MVSSFYFHTNEGNYKPRSLLQMIRSLLVPFFMSWPLALHHHWPWFRVDRALGSIFPAISGLCCTFRILMGHPSPFTPGKPEVILEVWYQKYTGSQISVTPPSHCNCPHICDLRMHGYLVIASHTLSIHVGFVWQC